MAIPLKVKFCSYLILLSFLSTCTGGQTQTLACPEQATVSSQASNQTREPNPLFLVVRNRKWGFIDSTGKIVIKPQFNYAESFSEERAAFKSANGKWGFIDPTGKVAIEPQFDEVHFFFERRAGVKSGGKWGFIDLNGTVVVKPQFDRVSRFLEQRAAVQSGYRWGFIDPDGGFIAKPQFARHTDFSEGLAGFVTSQNNPEKSGFIDRDGKVVIELGDVNPDLEGVGFRNGLAAVWVRSPGVWSIVDALLDETGRGRKFWGFIDRNGRQVIPLKYEGVSSFSECLAHVQSGGKWGVINTLGQMVIQPQFTELPGNFSEGLASIKLHRQEGYIDKTGKIAIAPQFYLATYFHEGLASVQLNEGGKWGYIDKTGKIAIAAQFDEARRFENGLAWVRVGSKWGYINRTGKFVWKPTN
jgi:hypothetical protein